MTVKIKDVLDCMFCDSDNVKIIETYKGEQVKPDPLGECCTYFNQMGIVVKCKDCLEITGYLITPRGVVGDDYEE